VQYKTERGVILTTKLTDEVEFYYNQRKLIPPNMHDCFLFLASEVGEVADEIMQWKGGFTRNNPLKEQRKSDDEHIEAIGEELGDVIMMAVMTGRSIGIDPILCLKNKMERKLKNTP
jgi:NTP pyrophosphatase (non-canonical NTP hydrolase)